MKPAAAYIRKSTKEDDRQIESFEGQRRGIDRFAEANGYHVVKWYEEAYTGTEVKHRKVFLRMLDDARSGTPGFQYVICYDISRFGRLDNDEAGYYRHEFRRCGVEVVYAMENLQGDDTDDLIISTKQWLAREYSRKIGEYVTRNILTRSAQATEAKRAFSIGRAAPFGYDTVYIEASGRPYAVVRQMPDRSKEVYDIDGNLTRTIPRGTRFRKASTDLNGLVPSSPERVETMRRIFRWYVEDNLGQFAIVQKLNEAHARGKGPASPTGKPWTVGTIQSILQNEHYIGNTVFNKRCFAKFYTIRNGEMAKQSRVRRVHVERNRREDWIVIEGTHEPLVDPDLFRRAQARRRTRRLDRGQNGRAHYIFSGKLRCANCGHSFHGKLYRTKKGEKLGYVCSGYKARGTSVCRQHFLPESILEEAVVKALAKELGALHIDGAVETAAREIAESPGPSETKRSEMVAKMARLDADLNRLLQCITPENKEIVSKKMVALEDEKETLARELDALEAGPAEVQSSETVRRLLELARDFAGLWAQATVAEKREFFLSVVDRVAIHPDRKKARLYLSRNFLRVKELQHTRDGELCPSDGRGDPKPSARQSIVAYLDIGMPSWKAA